LTTKKLESGNFGIVVRVPASQPVRSFLFFFIFYFFLYSGGKEYVLSSTEPSPLLRSGSAHRLLNEFYG
jgi:hypothetical protein